MDEMKKSWVVFDVCDTLYFSNTTFDFILYISKKRGKVVREIVFHLMNSRFSPVFYCMAIFATIFKTDLNRLISIFLLKGYYVEELKEYATKFVDEYLFQRRIPESHQLMELSDKSNIILASSSLDLLVERIAERLDVKNYISSELEYKDEVCTGRLKSDLTGQKHLRLQAMFEGTIAKVVTDNLTDKQLLALSGERYVVLRKPNHIKHWEGFSAHYINPEK